MKLLNLIILALAVAALIWCIAHNPVMKSQTLNTERAYYEQAAKEMPAVGENDNGQNIEVIK